MINGPRQLLSEVDSVGSAIKNGFWLASIDASDAKHEVGGVAIVPVTAVRRAKPLG